MTQDIFKPKVEATQNGTDNKENGVHNVNGTVDISVSNSRKYANRMSVNIDHLTNDQKAVVLHIVKYKPDLLNAKQEDWGDLLLKELASMRKKLADSKSYHKGKAEKMQLEIDEANKALKAQDDAVKTLEKANQDLSRINSRQKKELDELREQLRVEKTVKCSKPSQLQDDLIKANENLAKRIKELEKEKFEKTNDDIFEIIREVEENKMERIKKSMIVDIVKAAIYALVFVFAIFVLLTYKNVTK